MTKNKLKKTISKDALAFMEMYLNTPTPTGYEWRGQQLWLDYIKPYVDDYKVDNYGTAYGIINPDSDYKVVIEAHVDEISWFVHFVSDDGFIYVIRNGGSDHQIAPSKRVYIHTRDGKVIDGAFGWRAIHLRHGGNKKNPERTNIFIDVGCTSKEEVEALGIHPGCVITYPDRFAMLNDRYYMGRALDNRMGGVMIAQIARLLRENKVKLPYGLYIVNSVQEEVGLRGAQMIAQTIKPDVALVTDVGHDTSTPMITKSESGDYKCGKGPIVAIAPAVHNKFLDLILEQAHKNEIPFQYEANSRSTGTDADAFAYSNGGIVTALISLPLRYMHTTVEMTHKDDVDNVIRLMYHTLLNIKYKHDFKYLQSKS